MLDKADYAPLNLREEDPKLSKNDLNATELQTSFTNGDDPKPISYPIKQS
jgi:hypothetical protein